MSENQNEEINKISIQFVNKKSKERVMKLVEDMKTCFAPIETKTEKIATKVVDLLDNKREEYIRHPLIDGLKQSEKEEPIMKASTAPLKPFLFPAYPSSIQGDYAKNSEERFAKSRRQFMIESREEHQRLLYAFQDRLTRELCTADEHFLASPFQDAMANISLDQNIPPSATEKRKEAIQSRFNSLMRRSQKQTIAVLENQKRCAKLLQDQEMFTIIHDQKESAADSLKRNPAPITISFPFSFLSDGGYAK